MRNTKALTLFIVILLIASLGCIGGSNGTGASSTTSSEGTSSPSKTTTPMTSSVGSSTSSVETTIWRPPQGEKNVTVTFVVSVPEYTPQNASVYIAGDFNGWNPKDERFRLQKLQDGRWAINLTFPYGTVINFKFTRGSWESVEVGPSGEEIPSRHFIFRKGGVYELRVYNWHDHVERVAHTISGNVKVFKMFSSQLNRTVRVWVYLPPDYGKNEKKRYPVLYMLDGQNLFDNATAFAGEWGVDETLEYLYNKTGFSIIVVGIDNGGERRIDEYAPWVNAEYGRGDLGNATLDFIVENLKPYIDALYRTEREETGIMGSSLGGLMAIYAGFRHPDIFKYVGAMSSAFWFNPEIYDFVRNAPGGPEKIYIYWGASEGSNPEKIAEDNLKIVEILKEKGYVEGQNLKVVVEEKGEHNELYWGKHFGEAVTWLFGG